MSHHHAKPIQLIIFKFSLYDLTDFAQNNASTKSLELVILIQLSNEDFATLRLMILDWYHQIFVVFKDLNDSIIDQF